MYNQQRKDVGLEIISHLSMTNHDTSTYLKNQTDHDKTLHLRS